MQDVWVPIAFVVVSTQNSLLQLRRGNLRINYHRAREIISDGLKSVGTGYSEKDDVLEQTLKTGELEWARQEPRGRVGLKRPTPCLRRSDRLPQLVRLRELDPSARLRQNVRLQCPVLDCFSPPRRGLPQRLGGSLHPDLKLKLSPAHRRVLDCSLLPLLLLPDGGSPRKRRMVPVPVQIFTIQSSKCHLSEQNGGVVRTHFQLALALKGGEKTLGLADQSVDNTAAFVRAPTTRMASGWSVSHGEGGSRRARRPSSSPAVRIQTVPDQAPTRNAGLSHSPRRVSAMPSAGP